jgi:hypothetical protein
MLDRCLSNLDTTETQWYVREMLEGDQDTTKAPEAVFSQISSLSPADKAG